MTTQDTTIIRDLVKRVAEVAARPEQDEKRRLWYAQNSLKPIRPLVFCSPEGSWEELLPDDTLACRDREARDLERGLRMRLYAAEHFHDDQVCDNAFLVPYAVHNSGWGIGPTYTYSDFARGAYVWDPPLKTHADLDRIQTPTASHDPEASQRKLESYQELLGDLMDVRLCGRFWWALGLIDEWTLLRGITQTFWDMADDPQLVHAGMSRLLEGKLAWLDSLVALGVLSLNNDNDYVGSGGFGFTHELPAQDFDGHVRLVDLWGFCEAQTMSEVSPAMHEEFVLRYQLPILERFGLNCYGCCEPLHRKLEMLKKHVPRLRRVSISPWADKRLSAEALGPHLIFSWKPNPASLAALEFDPEWVRGDVRETIQIAQEHGCVLEMILKDTHTCNHRPCRFDQWTSIASEEAQRAAS